jgi:hypothetical protein
MRMIALGSVAVLLAAAPDGRTTGPTPASYLFGGRIIAADSGSLDGVHVIATDAQGTYEALIDSSGTFVGSFPTQPSTRVTLRIFSDSAIPRYHTSLVTLGPGVPGEATRIVLVPRKWRVRGGPFDGREVSIDPARATTRYGDGPGYWRLSRRSGRAVTWVPDSFPIRVAFRHAASDPFISPSDSIRFWDLATSLERALGRRLFRPASYEEVDGGADGIFVAVNRRMAAAGKTYITYEGTGRIYEALLTVSQNAYLGEPRVAMHEMLHALGFGHTGGWPSIMGPNADGVESPTAEDVAYAQLFYAISQLQRDREAQVGIAESAR